MPAFDETAPARRTAERFGTEHTEFRVKPSAIDLLDTLIWHHDGAVRRFVGDPDLHGRPS